jgi:hypothetical protein
MKTENYSKKQTAEEPSKTLQTKRIVNKLVQKSHMAHGVKERMPAQNKYIMSKSASKDPFFCHPLALRAERES